MLRFFVLSILLPVVVISQASHCYRCFGSSWCNNFTNPTFASNVHIVECPIPNNNHINYKGNNPYTLSLLNSIRSAEELISGPGRDESLMGCVTATVHEEHEDHTVRVCLNQASIICPAIRNVVLANVNDISPDVTISCEGCTGVLCNEHTFAEDRPEPTTVPPPLTIIPTTASPSIQTSSPTTPSEIPSSSDEPPSTTTSESLQTTTPSSGDLAFSSYLVLLLAIFLDILLM